MTARQPRNWKADVDAIRNVLISDWDPIGCGVPEDEYDGYIPVIYRLIQAKVSANELAAHLQKLETGSMGLSAHPARDLRVANSLLRLWDSEQKEF